ncbi:hypothetical protein PQD71_gp094 [Kosakonia phage Kc263]|uniref:Virion structural protein n=1 Tax=Kosakonia phage Kc263 TaxID=2863194 RepID=A0AAE8BGI4_9CAUD|nr:hypothetical protein PQD71_gp094 [Kosakonia phage Kc263]QYN79987.1 hypothetical protein [Kosakonia phage Kc263]
MIIINETPKLEVLVAIDKESAHVKGLLDTIHLLKDSPENIAAVNGYIQKNAVLRGIENQLKKGLNPHADLIDSLEYAAKQLDMWLPKLRDRVLKSKTSVYDVETITFREKGILDIVSALNFFNRYATMVLNIVLTQAAKEVNFASFLTKVDITFFNNTPTYFAGLLIRFSQSVKSLEDMVDNLSDETYDATSEEILRNSVGDKAVSALRGLAPHELNPLYWWKRRQMKADIKAIVDTNQDIDMLAMKIARLNNRRDGTNDPDIDRQIEVYQDALIKKQGKIMQIEAKYGN